MNQSTFDTFIRDAVTIFDRRSLFGGASAALLAAAGLPLVTEAKKGKHKKRNKNKRGKACKKRVKECRQETEDFCQPGDPANCEELVSKCCKIACKSFDRAEDCVDAIGTS